MKYLKAFLLIKRFKKRDKKKLKEKNVFYPSIWHENKSGAISINDYSCALRAGASYNYLLVNGVRRLTERELLRLQGFPEDFKIVVSASQIKKQTGNSVAVPVIRAVSQKMLQYMYNQKTDKVELTENHEGQVVMNF